MQRAAVAAIALLCPVLFVGNGIYLLAHDWFVHFEYARPGLPADPYGMSNDERTRLAETSLRSILPWERRGTGVLVEARFDDGREAFDDRELSHMRDVRRLLAVLLALHAAALVALVALAVRARTRPLAVRALRAGALFTLGLFGLVAVLLLVEEDWFLTGFHTIFFSGSSWRFGDTDTLRRLFPDRFWRDTAFLLGIGAALQATAVLVAAYWRRLVRRRPEPRGLELGS